MKIVVSVRLEQAALAKAMDGLHKLGHNPTTLAHIVSSSFFMGINQMMGVDATNPPTNTNFTRILTMTEQRQGRSQKLDPSSLLGTTLPVEIQNNGVQKPSFYIKDTTNKISDETDRGMAKRVLEYLNNGYTKIDANLTSDDSELIRITAMLLMPQISSFPQYEKLIRYSYSKFYDSEPSTEGAS